MADEVKQPQKAQEVTLIIARHDHAADGLLLPDGLVNAYMVGRNMQQAYGIKAIDHVYCSTLIRTQQTMLAQAMGMATADTEFKMPSYSIHEELHEDTPEDTVWQFIQQTLTDAQQKGITTIEMITHKPQACALMQQHFKPDITNDQLDCGCHAIIRASSWKDILTQQNLDIRLCPSSQTFVNQIFNNNNLYTVADGVYNFNQNAIQQLTDPTLRDQITAMQQMYNEALKLYHTALPQDAAKLTDILLPKEQLEALQKLFPEAGTL